MLHICLFANTAHFESIKMAITLRPAKDGCASNISFCGMPVFHEFESLATHSIDDLGAPRDKLAWLKCRVSGEDLKSVQDMLVDWELYEHGWVVRSPHTNGHLFSYKCQLTRHEPEALNLLLPPIHK